MIAFFLEIWSLNLVGSRQALQGGATGVIGQDVPYPAVWNFETDCREISEPFVTLWELLKILKVWNFQLFVSANLKIRLVFTGLA